MKALYLWLFIGSVIGGAAFAFSLFRSSERKVVVEREKIAFDIPKEKIKRVVLENGMNVLVYQTKQVPKVLVQIAYDVGSGVEESGERGLAHLIEHMIFKGTEKLAEGDIEAIARKYGATLNAFTSKDMTSYYFEVNKNNWKPFLGILADCMQNARFEDQHLNSELKAVLQELRMLKDNYFQWMFQKSSELLYPANHPYHHPVIGYKEDLLLLSGQRLKDFYNKYYHPNHATLFIVGDVDGDEVVALAHEHFEKINGRDEPREKLVPQDLIELENQVNRVYEDIKNESQGFYWKVPGLKVGNKALTEVVSGVLGQGEGSPLYRRLVDEENVATSVDTGVLQQQESGIFFIIVEPKEGQADRCKTIVQEELRKIIEHGIDEKALTKVVRQKERSFLSMMQNAQALTYQWMQSLFATDDEYALFRRLDEYYKVDQAAIRSYFKTYLDPFLINELNVLPLPEDKRELWTYNKAQSEQIDAAILQKFERTLPLEEPKFVMTMPEPNKLEFTFPKPDEIVTLENDLKVIFHKSTHVPIIQVSCRFKDASFLSSSKEGLLLELMMSMLMEGSVGFSKKENVDFFELYGAGYSFGSDGAQLSTVNVSYKPLLERLFHVLTKPEFTQKALDKLKAIYVDSLQRSKDSPQEVAIRLFKSMVYKNHPFGWNLDEAIEYIKQATLQDIKELHKEYVSSNNMMLVLGGDFDQGLIESEIKKIFGSWSGGAYQKPEIKAGDFVPGDKKDHVMLRDQVVLLLGQASPIDIHHPDITPLKLLNFINFYSMGSRLFELRERTGLFYTASGAFAQGASKVHGVDLLYALLSVDKLDDAEGKIRELVDNIGRDGVTQPELDDARQWFLKGLIDLVSSVPAVTGTLGTLAEFDLGFDYYDKVLKRVQTITVEELNRICAKYYKSDGFIRVRVGRV